MVAASIVDKVKRLQGRGRQNIRKEPARTHTGLAGLFLCETQCGRSDVDCRDIKASARQIDCVCSGTAAQFHNAAGTNGSALDRFDEFTGWPSRVPKRGLASPVGRVPLFQ